MVVFVNKGRQTSMNLTLRRPHRCQTQQTPKNIFNTIKNFWFYFVPLCVQTYLALFEKIPSHFCTILVSIILIPQDHTSNSTKIILFYLDWISIHQYLCNISNEKRFLNINFYHLYPCILLRWFNPICIVKL